MNLAESLVRDHVRDLGMSDPVVVPGGATIAEVIAVMQRERVGCVIVVQQQGRDGRPAAVDGLFTERDVLKRVLVDGVALTVPVSTVMTRNPDTLVCGDAVADVIRRMYRGGYRHMPVLDDDGQLIGVASVKRIAHYFVSHFPEAVYNLPPDPASIATTREGG